MSQSLLFPQRPVATLKAFATSKPPACALSLSLSAHISYSAHAFFPTSSPLSCLPLPFLFPLCLLFLLSCSLICLFPLSSVCTMPINYSEAVCWFLRLIQSGQGSALMGSCCTCYRLRHTLETTRGGRGDSWGGGRMWGRDKDSEPTQTNRNKDREDEIFYCFSPLSWGAVIDVPVCQSLSPSCCHTLRTAHTSTYKLSCKATGICQEVKDKV